jgi:hypothetical protein
MPKPVNPAPGTLIHWTYSVTKTGAQVLYLSLGSSYIEIASKDHPFSTYLYLWSGIFYHDYYKVVTRSDLPLFMHWKTGKIFLQLVQGIPFDQLKF